MQRISCSCRFKKGNARRPRVADEVLAKRDEKPRPPLDDLRHPNPRHFLKRQPVLDQIGNCLEIYQNTSRITQWPSQPAVRPYVIHRPLATASRAGSLRFIPAQVDIRSGADKNSIVPKIKRLDRRVRRAQSPGASLFPTRCWGGDFPAGRIRVRHSPRSTEPS